MGGPHGGAPRGPIAGGLHGGGAPHFAMGWTAWRRRASRNPAAPRNAVSPSPGSGRIVNISSGAGLAASLTGIQAYCSAKHAVVGFTRQLAHELGPFGITVNSIAPGFIRSNPASEKQWAGYGEEGQRALVERIAMKRLGTAQDIANSVVFFASDLAGFVNGQVLAVDGGK